MEMNVWNNKVNIGWFLLVAWIPAACLLALVSCSKEERREVPPVRVETAKVIQKDVKNYIEAIGNVYETSIVQIRPQVQGILLKAYASQGDFVQKGDLLYEIDPRPYQAALDQAEANLTKNRAALELAQSTVKRYADVAAKDYISALTFEQYNSNVKSAAAQVETDTASVEIAQINLDYSKITSPIDGKISVYNIYPGNLVVVNDPTALTEIRQITPADIRFSIPQKDFQEIQNSQKGLDEIKLEVFLPYDNDRRFQGTLYFIDNHVDLQTGMILLKGLVPNEDKILWPGEFVRVRILTSTLENALVIPLSALQTGQKGKYVYVVRPDMSVDLVYVTTGIQTDSEIVITTGLNPNDIIVTNGQLNLRNGSKVLISHTQSTEEQAVQ